MFQENKACQTSRKTNISYPLIRTRTCAYQGVKKFAFRKIWRALFSCNTHFDIHPFCLITDKKYHFNPFQVTVLFLYELEASENQRFLNIFKCYKKRQVTWNGLIDRKPYFTSWYRTVVKHMIYNQGYIWQYQQKTMDKLHRCKHHFKCLIIFLQPKNIWFDLFYTLFTSVRTSQCIRILSPHSFNL